MHWMHFLPAQKELLEAGAPVDSGTSSNSPLELAAGCGSHSVQGKAGALSACRLCLLEFESLLRGPPGSAAAYSEIVNLLLNSKCV